MPTPATEQRRLFKIRRVAQWMRYRYPIAMTITGELPLAAAPLYETKAPSKAKQGSVRLGAGTFIHNVAHMSTNDSGGTCIIGKGSHLTIIKARS